MRRMTVDVAELPASEYKKLTDLLFRWYVASAPRRGPDVNPDIEFTDVRLSAKVLGEGK